MSYASNNNALLIDGCRNLQNFSVLLKVTEDLGTTDGGGWSFQLNCYPPAGEYCQTSELTWLQYIVYVQNGQLAYEVQYWATGAGATWPSGYTPQPNTTPWLPCWPNDYFLSGSFATINGDTLPRQSVLEIALETTDSGGVKKVVYTYTDPDGDDHSAEFDLPVWHPIVACELNLVGPGNSTAANFTQGLTNSRGIVYYSVSSGQLSVQSGGAGAACGEAAVFTGETSNMTYSDISNAPGATVTQTLQQPVACAITHLFSEDRAQIGQLQQIRDRHVAPHPAGQWLVELLDRHAADIALLLASDEADLAARARTLLTQAAQSAQEGRAFDSATIDDALATLQTVSRQLPTSMTGASPAAATLIEALRGRTLEEGLKIASTTIRPRSGSSPGPCQNCGPSLRRRVADLEQRVRQLEFQASRPPTASPE